MIHQEDTFLAVRVQFVDKAEPVDDQPWTKPVVANKVWAHTRYYDNHNHRRNKPQFDVTQLKDKLGPLYQQDSADKWELTAHPRRLWHRFYILSREISQWPQPSVTRIVVCTYSYSKKHGTCMLLDRLWFHITIIDVMNFNLTFRNNVQ